MNGVRKSSKITCLISLNQQFNLGMSTQDITEMTTSQLKKTIYKIRKKHNLPVNKTAQTYEED